MLKNRNQSINICILLVMANVFLIHAANAQNDESNALNSFQKFRNMFTGQDMLEKSFSSLEAEKADREGRLIGVDGETALMLKRMRNPFESQIPQPIVEEPAVEQPEEPEPELPLELPLPLPEQEEKIPQPGDDDYIISGLVWNSDRPQAIVNGQVIDVGDHLDYWQVVRIDQSGIEITYREQSYIIKPKGAANVE